MNSYIALFSEFFKVGLFTFGGGYASLPFLYHISDCYHWFTSEQLTQMIAIAGLTPGPVGLNVATFAGFKTLGFLGALIASFALCLPMLIITSTVFRLYKKFSKSKLVQSILRVLRPASCALILAVAIKLFNNFVLAPKDIKALVLILILFLMTLKCPRNPVIYMGFAAVYAVAIFLIRQFI